VTGLPLEIRRELLGDAMRTVEYPVIQSTAFDVTPATLTKPQRNWSWRVSSPSVRGRSTSRGDVATPGANTRSIDHKSL
jgi:hypothetical protein